MAEDPQQRLRTYRRKRDFTRTPEPGGATSTLAPSRDDGLRFVVQRHRARRLHYDLRLEMAGVLASWAVPKGPTLDPAVKRMAIHVEDHPLDYFDFEGIIPEGEYGGGDVIVWDWGTWLPVGTEDPVAAIAGGELHFELDGEKLAGRFILVRRGREDDQWLLIHKRDDHAVDGWDPEQHPESVKSGLDNDAVAARRDDVWHHARETEHLPAPTAAELDELDALGQSGTWQLQGREIKLTKLDKVLYPEGGDRPAVTKRDLVRYLAAVGPWMVPYLQGRPVNLVRMPDGVGGTHFWQKARPHHAPDWLARWHYGAARSGETEWYSVIDSIPAAVWWGQQAALEFHGWTSTADHPDQPTWAMIDIDPGEATTWDDVLVLARLYRTALDHLGVLGCPKVTGKRGIQIWVPVGPGIGFDTTRGWVETISRAIGATVPELVSWKWEKEHRKGLARLDYTQNAVNRTLVTPFSPRAAPGAPVSVPIRWDELDDPELRPDRWTVGTVLDRLAEVGDPLAALRGLEQELPHL